MKFIENSIDSEHLQDSISDTDFEKQMANCEVKSKLLNGHHSGGLQTLKENKMERVEAPKLTNGIHKKSEPPTKCNGESTRFYEEEDFNLVLEDSSEGGESPLKKIDDDTLSAPQIVQQITDLLGINSNSDVIQEELNNLDGTESIEDNLDNVEDIEDSQELDGKNIESTEENKETPNGIPTSTEYDSSTNMNLVFDEVEVGMENGDLHPSDESNLTSGKSSEIDCKATTTTENKDPSKIEDLVATEIKDTTEQKDNTKTESSKKITSDKESVTQTQGDGTVIENSEQTDVLDDSGSLEVPTTQGSGLSENPEEWLVLDAIETSEEENHLENQELSTTIKAITNELQNSRSVEIEDKLKSEQECSISTPNSSEPCEKIVDTNDEKIVDTNDEKILDTNDEKNVDKNGEKIVDTNGEKMVDTNYEKIVDTNDEKIVDTNDEKIVDTNDEKIVDTNDTIDKSMETSLKNEGDEVRKRCAISEDEDVSLKKPKLDQSSSSFLKRPLPATTESESKRTKLIEPIEECETFNINCEATVKEKSGETKTEIVTESVNDNQITDSSIASTSVKESSLVEKENDQKNHAIEEETHTDVSSCSGGQKTSPPNDVDLSVKDEELTSCVPSLKESEKDNKVDSTPIEASSSSTKTSEITHKENEPSLILISKENLNKVISDKTVSTCEESKSVFAEKTEECGVLEEKKDSDENKENVSSSISDTPHEEKGFKLDDLSPGTHNEPIESVKPKEVNSLATKPENKIDARSKQISIAKELSSSIKELEKSVIKSGIGKVESSRDLKPTETKKMTNLDFAIERVVEKARIQVEKKVPILKKFHKDQLKKLTRSELEEIVVSKICEAVTYKSEIGQMRLRTQNLEETNEVWRKKVQQIEKQNRELEMVLKKFLTELAHIKRENQNKVPMPIKVTRSVGLQVVLASSMHGALVASRNKINSESVQQQIPVVTKVKQPEKEKAKETVKATTFMPPSTSTGVRGRGRPAKNTTPSTPQAQTLPPKMVSLATPTKPTTPVKTIPTPNKDLEVIDLTDKEEKAKSALQTPTTGSIRVSPSTQVCFVQQNPTSTPTQQPLYLVQKPGQRSQFLVATSTASPQRPLNTSGPPPPLTLPVFRAGGHFIPVQTTQVGVKATTNTTPSATRQVPPPLRIHSSITATKHPAPLPNAPMCASKPGMKAPPPRPQLKIAKTANGIMLSWSMSLTKDMADMQSYQLYAYQEGNQPPSTGLWKKVGDVKALPLPMACTLTQFIEGHKYHFAVRAVDTHGRIGPFSTPSSILLTK